MDGERQRGRYCEMQVLAMRPGICHANPQRLAGDISYTVCSNNCVQLYALFVMCTYYCTAACCHRTCSLSAHLGEAWEQQGLWNEVLLGPKHRIGIAHAVCVLVHPFGQVAEECIHLGIAQTRPSSGLGLDPIHVESDQTVKRHLWSKRVGSGCVPETPETSVSVLQTGWKSKTTDRSGLQAQNAFLTPNIMMACIHSASFQQYLLEFLCCG